MTSVKDGGFYGWPYSYFGQHLDPRPEPQRPDLVAKAIVPDYALGAHTASLGLAFYEGKLLSERFAGGAFIAQHGSWNRRPLSGFKVIFVPFEGGQPPACPRTFSPVSSMPVAMHLGALPEWQLTGPAPCSLPTTWAIRSGG